MSVGRGFTLLELLVAMAASALLLALLSQVSGGLQGAAQRVLRGAEPQASEALARQALHRLLADVLPAADGDAANAFNGRPQSAEFTAVPPDAWRHLGAVRVRLLEAPVSAGQVGLFIEMRPAREAVGVQEAPRRELLLGPLQSVRFRYAANRLPGTSLLDHWSDKSAPPGWIHVVWRREGDGDQSTVVAAVRRNLPGDCRFDPISLICRGGDGR